MTMASRLKMPVRAVAALVAVMTSCTLTVTPALAEESAPSTASVATVAAEPSVAAAEPAEDTDVAEASEPAAGETGTGSDNAAETDAVAESAAEPEESSGETEPVAESDTGEPDADAEPVPTPETAQAAAMDFTVTGGEDGKDYEYKADASKGGVLTLHPSAGSVTLTVSMNGSLRHPSTADPSATKDRIVVTPKDGVTANVVLNGVKIDLSKDTSIDAAAFAHTSGKLNLTLASKSENKLISGPKHAGLEKNDLQSGPSANFTLTISSQGSGNTDWGSLLARSYGEYEAASSAGIGGSSKSSSYITITGGVVTADSYSEKAAANAAGIGGGNGGAGSYITVSGGEVTARSRSNGSETGNGNASGTGIGGGNRGAGSYITVSGGVVTAETYGNRYSFGAGIGGGSARAGSCIEISGGVVTARASGRHGAYGAGIGGGQRGSGTDIRISGGYVSANSRNASAIGAETNGVMITGGYFADTSRDAVTNNKVYGVTPADGYEVIANDGDDKNAYPVRVTTISMDFAVSGGELGVDYEYTPNVGVAKSGVLTLHPSSDSVTLTVSMKGGTLRHPSVADKTATKDRIVVTPKDGVTANVVLNGVKIDLSKDTDIDAAAFAHTSGKLNLTLASKSENKLISGPKHAGLEKNDLSIGPDEAFALTITSEGSNEADWGSLLAQSYSESSAYSVFGAGIGGGENGSGSYITVSGGKVTAQSYSGSSAAVGAGIGGGSNGDGSYITISGGVVTAQSYGGSGIACGAGIGGGRDGDGSDVRITGGSVKVIDGTVSSSSTTPQPTDGNGNNVYLAVVPASADHRTVRSCAASGDCSDTGGAWKTDWKIDGTHVNTDGTADANLYLWLPVSDGAAGDQFVRTSSADSSYTPYRAVYEGENADGATNPWQWFDTATSSTYTLSIPKTTVSMDEDTTGDTADVKVTDVKLVDPGRKLAVSGSVVGGTADDWTASDGLKLTRSDGNVALRSSVTDGNGTTLGGESPLLGGIGDGDSTATLHFGKPTIAGDADATVPAGRYTATLTFTVNEERR